MDIKITYEDDTTEIFKDTDKYRFWDKCERVLDVKYIKEVRK